MIGLTLLVAWSPYASASGSAPEWPAPEWPDEGEWQALTTGGVRMADEVGDATPPSQDLVRDLDGSTASWYADPSGLYLRMALDESPVYTDWEGRVVTTGSFYGWLFELDGTEASYEALVGVGYQTAAVAWSEGGDGWASDRTRGAEIDTLECACVAASPTGSYTSGDEDAWLLLYLPPTALGLAADARFQLFPTTWPWAAPGELPDDAPGPAPDAEQGALPGRWSDPLVLDADGDGLYDPQEAAHGTDPTRPDTDGGGLADGAEDRDGDGIVALDETDPLDPLDDADTDGDGISDSWEDTCALGGSAEDRDGDGRSDADEGASDPDGDGLRAYCDEDDDNDGLASAREGDEDTDDDGLIDPLDSDADADGEADGADGEGDDDCDGTPAFQDAAEEDGPCGDPDADGLTNAEEGACGSDPASRDSDGDGAEDAQEPCDRDVDCDQLPDRIDGVVDAGFCDQAPAPVDTACVEADPDDAWRDCPGAVGGGAGLAGCATGAERPSGWWLFVALVVRRRSAAGAQARWRPQ